MPKYEFKCWICHSYESHTQSIYDDIVTPECVICAIPMTRMYDVPAVQFNAPGFYQTDKGVR